MNYYDSKSKLMNYYLLNYLNDYSSVPPYSHCLPDVWCLDDENDLVVLDVLKMHQRSDVELVSAYAKCCTGWLWSRFDPEIEIYDDNLNIAAVPTGSMDAIGNVAYSVIVGHVAKIVAVVDVDAIDEAVDELRSRLDLRSVEGVELHVVDELNG